MIDQELKGMVASDNIDHPVKGMKDRNLFE
jgi:hypothetical protein